MSLLNDKLKSLIPGCTDIKINKKQVIASVPTAPDSDGKVVVADLVIASFQSVTLPDSKDKDAASQLGADLAKVFGDYLNTPTASPTETQLPFAGFGVGFYTQESLFSGFALQNTSGYTPAEWKICPISRLQDILLFASKKEAADFIAMAKSRDHFDRLKTQNIQVLTIKYTV